MNSSIPYESVSISLPEGAHRELLVHNPEYTVVRVCISKGVESVPHQHPHAQVVYLISGHGVFDIEGRRVELEPGHCVPVEPNRFHAFYPPEEDITFLEFFVPGREDIAQ